MSYDASAGALRCPFCGSTELVETARREGNCPRRRRAVCDSAQADAWRRCANGLGSSFWRPGDLSEQALVVSMTPVYVPFWVFDAQTHTYWTADSSHTPRGARASLVSRVGAARRATTTVCWSARAACLTAAETIGDLPFRSRPRPAARQSRFAKRHVRAVQRAAEICPAAGQPGLRDRWKARSASNMCRARRATCM